MKIVSLKTKKKNMAWVREPRKPNHGLLPYTVLPITLLMLTWRSSLARFTANNTRVSQETDLEVRWLLLWWLLCLPDSEWLTLDLCFPALFAADPGVPVWGWLKVSEGRQSVGDWGMEPTCKIYKILLKLYIYSHWDANKKSLLVASSVNYK